MVKLVAVRGQNDVKDKKGNWIRSWCEYSEDSLVLTQFHTISGSRWSDLLRRTKEGGRYQKLKPSYQGVENKFEGFQEFVEWSKQEIGYNLKESNGKFWQLDKDILSKDSKIYSVNTCLFVPNEVNCFLVSCTSARGEWPLGVCFDKNTKCFTAYCQEPKGKQIRLGTFNNPFDAHRAWQKQKIEFGKQLILKYKDPHIKLYNGFNEYLSIIEDQYLKNLETVR